MPPVIPQHLVDAKKRMKMGLHPAVLAAVARSAPANALAIGGGVNPGHARRVPAGGDMRAAMDPLAGQRYRSYLQQDDRGRFREFHVYNTPQGRQVRSFLRAADSPALQAGVGRAVTAAQHLSNTATAEDKMIALAHKAAAGKLARNPFQARKFSRKPGPMQRY